MDLFQSKKLPAPPTQIQGKVFRTSQFEKFAAGKNPHPWKGFQTNPPPAGWRIFIVAC